MLIKFGIFSYANYVAIPIFAYCQNLKQKSALAIVL